MSKARVTALIVFLLLAAAPPAAGRQADAPKPYRISLPDKGWALDVAVPPEPAPPPGAKPPQYPAGAVPAQPEFLSDDGREHFLLVFHRLDPKRPAASAHLLFRLRPAPAAGDAAAARAHVLKILSKGGLLSEGSQKTFEHGQIHVARYTPELKMGFGTWTPPGGGMRVTEAYLVKDDVWVTVTMMSREFGEREEKFFRAVLDSLRFTDTSAPSTGFDFYHKGRAYFLRRDYRRAAEALAQALELERQERRLDAESWRSLVGNLIDSYGALGEIARAKEVMDYAVQSDPSNPLFQIALARYYAKFGDLDNVIAHIEKATTPSKAERVALLRSYDPEHDPAFEPFRKDERFRKALKALKR